MRRLSFVINSVLLLPGGMNLLLAQERIAQHQGGEHAGHATQGMGSAREGHSHQQPSGTTISTLSGRYPSAGQLVYPTPIGLQPQYSGYTGINRGAIPSGSRHAGSRGYGYGGAALFSPYYYSTLGNDYGSAYPYSDPIQDQAAQSATVNANLLGEQVQRLSSEVEALRQEREAANAQPTRAPYQAPPEASQDESSTQPPLTLILRSGKQVQVKSYAVMGKEIWDFTAQPARRISLSSVDLNASKSATEASGAEFPDIH